MPVLDFWYEFASTYSYLSVMRVEEEAEHAGVQIRWRPFLLGPIFAAQGWDNSPFNIYPAKGRYMFRDMERLCAAQGLVFKRPQPFPQNSLRAARAALIGAAEGWIAPFSRAVFHAEFAQGAQISDVAVLAQCLSEAGADAENVLRRIEEYGIKNLLRAQTEEARAYGVFGAPSFVAADGELFWGDDRLEQALEWAKRIAEGPQAADKADAEKKAETNDGARAADDTGTPDKTKDAAADEAVKPSAPPESSK